MSQVLNRKTVDKLHTTKGNSVKKSTLVLCLLVLSLAMLSGCVIAPPTAYTSYTAPVYAYPTPSVVVEPSYYYGYSSYSYSYPYYSYGGYYPSYSYGSCYPSYYHRSVNYYPNYSSGYYNRTGGYRAGGGHHHGNYQHHQQQGARGRH